VEPTGREPTCPIESHRCGLPFTTTLGAMGQTPTPQDPSPRATAVEFRNHTGKPGGNQMIRITSVILLGMLSITVRAAEYMDAANEGESLTMAAVEIERAEHLRKACGEELPQLVSSFGKAALMWRDANATEIKAVQSFREHNESRRVFEASVGGALGAWKATYALMTTEARRRQCLGYLVFAKEQKQRISDRTPKVSLFAGQYLSRNPLSALALEEYDHRMGCEKQAANRGLDYEKSMAACQCQWVAFRNGLTGDERAKFNSMAGNVEAVRQWPAAMRVVESAGACHRKYLPEG
jgi:hypothetical protein